MAKPPSNGGPSATDTAELESLRQENAALDEQLKLLSRAEQRLHRSQLAIDRQLARIEALDDLALGWSSNTPETEILESAISLIPSYFAVDVALALRVVVEPSDRLSSQLIRMVASEEAPNCVERLHEVTNATVLDIGPTLSLWQQELISMLDGSTSDDPIEARAVIIPITAEGRCPQTFLVALKYKHSRSSFYRDTLGSQARPFLALLGGHVERAIRNSILTFELKARTADLVASNEKLQASIEEVQQAQQQLLQTTRMEAIGRLAGGVAHDFNNLLTVILGLSKLMRTEPDRNPKCDPDLDQIIHAAERAARLTSQLLAFGRRSDAHVETIDANEAVAQISRLVTRLIGEDVELYHRRSKRLPLIRIDRSHFEQLIVNLVVNARDATRSGGTITIETESEHLEETLIGRPESVPLGDYVVLTVKDTGHGIGADDVDRIFEPFFTTKPVGQGSGMGLAIVHGIAKQYDGFTQVRPNKPKGTTVSVYLPAGGARQEDTGEKGLTDGAGQRRKTILVVEDESGIRDLMKRLLISQGYRVLVAGNGVEALIVSGQFHETIDLLVTDVVMPRMGGAELAAKLRDQREAIDVVFTSGYPGEKLANHGFPDGLEDYLPKPFTPDEFLSRVRAVLER